MSSQQCLQDMQVRQSIGDGDKETDTMHIAVQEANSTTVLRLNQAGYDAQHKTNLNKRWAQDFGGKKNEREIEHWLRE
jgi:hypothetical protein